MKNVVRAIAAVVVLAAIAVWQFYLFVTFTGAESGGTSHLWWAVAMTVFACAAAFLVLSIFVRHDTEDDLHVTSTGRA